MIKKNFANLITLTLASTVILGGCSLMATVPVNEAVQNVNESENITYPEVMSDSGYSGINVVMKAEEVLKIAKESGAYSDEQLRVLTLEYKLDSEGLTESEFHELEATYDEIGFIKAERDLLELEYSLYGCEGAIEKLNMLSVNIAEDDATVITEINQILYDLSVQERFSEVIHSLEADEWFAPMMSKIRSVERTYFREQSGVADFSLEVSSNEAGLYKGTIRFLPTGSLGETTGVIISREADIIKIYLEVSSVCNSVTDIAGQNGNRSFILYTIDCMQGSVRIEEGSMTDGVFTGNYKVTDMIFDGGSDSENGQSAFDLYNNSVSGEATGEIYNGEFDENGKSLVEEPSAKNVKTFADSLGTETVAVYAYNSDKTRCLYKGITKAEKEAGVQFGSEELKLPKEPLIRNYKVRDKSTYSLEGIVKVLSGTPDGNSVGGSASSADSTTYIAEEDLKVRIYNGEIQIYNGSAWVSMGDASEIAKADPFNSVTESGNGEVMQVASNRPSTGVGVIKADTPTNSGGSKPSNTSGSSGNTGNRTGSSSGSGQTSSGGSSQAGNSSAGQNVQPTPQPAPTPSPQPDPAPSNPAPSNPEPSNPDPGDGGGDGGGAPQDPPQTPSDDNRDSDVEYSPDID